MFASMYYYNLVIFLLETLRGALRHDETHEDIERTQQDAKIRFETLLRLYYVRHGFDSYDIFMIQYLSFLGFIHLNDLDSTEPSEYEERLSTIVLTAMGLRQQSQNCYLAKVVYRILKSKIEMRTRGLIINIKGLEDDTEDQKILMSEHLHSAWPVDIVSLIDDPEARRLDNLVRTAGSIYL